MERVLIIEDSAFFVSVLKRSLAKNVHVAVDVAFDMAEARRLIEDPANDYFLVLADLNLPDAEGEEVVEYVRSRGLPTVVFTGSHDIARRQKILRHRIIDYVFKDTPSSLRYVTQLVKRIRGNMSTKALVVDDSATSRRYVADMLRGYLFEVIEAANAAEALAAVKADPGIRLVVTDYNMPDRNGFELVIDLRRDHDLEDMAIIGVSASGEQEISSLFIKYGANDFLHKPFRAEELLCRVSHNMNAIDQMRELRDWATKDYLTGLFNRRYFFEAARTLFASAKRGQVKLSVALVDADHFKKVNDTHGHDGGDAVLKALAGILGDHVRETDIVARFGGEEFCLLSVNLGAGNAEAYYEGLRARIEAAEIPFQGRTLRVTASIGVCSGPRESLDDMITVADEMLYAAKEGGRNRVASRD